jgi:hypothetical protein
MLFVFTVPTLNLSQQVQATDNDRKDSEVAEILGRQSKRQHGAAKRRACESHDTCHLAKNDGGAAEALISEKGHQHQKVIDVGGNKCHYGKEERS